MEFIKPRVATYYFVIPQTNFRNDGAPLFSTHNLKKILGKENVVHLAPHGDISHFGKFDLHLLIDHGEDGLPVPQNFEYPHPNAYWVSDTHLGYDYRLKTARQFDNVFCCQKRARDEFIRDGIPAEKVHWLPHAVDETCYKPQDIIERWDWSFVGYLNSESRIQLLDRFLKEFPKGYIGWRYPEFKGHNVFEQVSRKFCQSKIIPNMTIADDISMRYFEAMACKKLFLTNDIPTIPFLFEPGKHLMTFKSIDEAVQIAKEMLANDERRISISEAGYQEVISKHTYRHRMLTILETCLGYKPDEQLIKTGEINAH